MKKPILVLAASVFITSALLISCSTPAEKVVNAEKNVEAANTALDKASDDFLADMEKYKKDADDKFAANEKSIADFNARIEGQKKNARAEYKKKIIELNQKNSDIKKKMDDYKANGKENWEKFKTEFSHDIDELGKAFNEFTINNVK